jgi:hypothetical protein
VKLDCAGLPEDAAGLVVVIAVISLAVIRVRTLALTALGAAVTLLALGVVVRVELLIAACAGEATAALVTPAAVGTRVIDTSPATEVGTGAAVAATLAAVAVVAGQRSFDRPFDLRRNVALAVAARHRLRALAAALALAESATEDGRTS